MSGNYLGWFSLLEQKLDLVRAPCPFGLRMKRKIGTMQLASRLMLLDGAFILTQYILLAYQQTLLLHSIT